MTTKIRATFVKRRFHDSGSDQAPDYYVYEFTKIIDGNNKNLGDRWIKETKLLKAVEFKKGKQYEITLSSPYFLQAINLPYPIEISWGTQKAYIKGGNAICVVNNGRETNLSVPITKLMGVNNFDTAAINKFSKGMMTKELLLKMNARRVYFYIHYYDPQDKRKNEGRTIGYTKEGNENYILIQKETLEEINKDLKSIKAKYLSSGIEKYFNIRTEILLAKRKKK